MYILYIYSFNEFFSFELIAFPSKAKNYLRKNPMPDLRSLLLCCWPGLSMKLPNIQTLALGLHIEVEGKSLLLKTSYNSETWPDALS